MSAKLRPSRSASSRPVRTAEARNSDRTRERLSLIASPRVRSVTCANGLQEPAQLSPGRPHQPGCAGARRPNARWLSQRTVRVAAPERVERRKCRGVHVRHEKLSAVAEVHVNRVRGCAQPAKQYRSVRAAQLPAERRPGAVDAGRRVFQAEPVVRLGHDRGQPGIGHTEVGQHRLVNGQRVRSRVDVPDHGGPAAAHHPERAVRHRRPGVDDREIRRRDVEQHHGRGPEVDPAPRVEGLVDGAGAALQRGQARGARTRSGRCAASASRSAGRCPARCR